VSDKTHDYGGTDGEGTRQYWLHCPGCQNDHAFTVGGPVGAQPRWTFNGSFDRPSFQPSLLCNRDYPESRCHSFVTDGRIQFLSDCWHSLAGKTVDLPDWDNWAHPLEAA
jgi:hypothetical protein